MTFKPGSEDEIHHAIRTWILAVLPDAVCLHVPNGMYVGGDRRAMAHIARLKALGLTPGAPDLLVFPGGGRVLWLEIKRPKGSSVSAEQAAFGVRMAALDIPWRVCRSVSDARNFLSDLGIKTREAVAA